MQEAKLKGLTSPIEAYSCNLHVLDLVEDSLQVACMITEDWQQAQLAGPILGQVIVKMQGRTLGQCLYKPTDSPRLWQHLWEYNHLKLRQGVFYRKVLLRGSQEALFQLVLPAMPRETVLEGCHDEIATWTSKECLT